MHRKSAPCSARGLTPVVRCHYNGNCLCRFLSQPVLIIQLFILKSSVFIISLSRQRLSIVGRVSPQRPAPRIGDCLPPIIDFHSDPSRTVYVPASLRETIFPFRLAQLNDFTLDRSKKKRYSININFINIVCGLFGSTGRECARLCVTVSADPARSNTATN